MYKVASDLFWHGGCSNERQKFKFRCGTGGGNANAALNRVNLCTAAQSRTRGTLLAEAVGCVVARYPNSSTISWRRGSAHASAQRGQNPPSRNGTAYDTDTRCGIVLCFCYGNKRFDARIERQSSLKTRSSLRHCKRNTPEVPWKVNVCFDSY